MAAVDFLWRWEPATPPETCRRIWVRPALFPTVHIIHFYSCWVLSQICSGGVDVPASRSPQWPGKKSWLEPRAGDGRRETGVARQLRHLEGKEHVNRFLTPDECDNGGTDPYQRGEKYRSGKKHRPPISNDNNNINDNNKHTITTTVTNDNNDNIKPAIIV